MQTLILTLHIIVCVVLVILILLQAGKEGMGVIFGGGNTSVFGSSGAGGMLAKMTAFMAVVFVVTSLSYTYVTSSRPSDESAVLKVEPLTIEDVPAKPAAAPEAAAPAQPAATSEAPAAPEVAPADAAAPADAPEAPAASEAPAAEAPAADAPAAQPAQQ
ncbi:preprotein translocase subunit SecG [Desulfovibrio sp.]|uniref:preprotein translocase subunit SecG n=1 Tax=Desulfovibrio sp. TaxID=885 RepID=UPI00307A6529